MINPMNACCFTGHRDLPEDVSVLREKMQTIISDLTEDGVKTFYAGGARGFDTLAEEAVLAVKERKNDPEIKLILVFPCRSQTRGWTAEERERYEQIKKNADEIIYTSDEYYQGCMHTRNRFMVDNSSYCIFYVRKKSGGSAYTLKYAKRRGLILFDLS